MKTNQPIWKLIANLGDKHPIDYGGYFVFVDETGVYAPEGELLEVNDSGESADLWTVYRFTLERCTWINGLLSDNKFHPEHPAWFAQPEAQATTRPQDTCYLSNLAEFYGVHPDALRSYFCAEDPILRANPYKAVGEYHGFENLDGYPLTFKTRAEVEARYAKTLEQLKQIERKH